MSNKPIRPRVLQLVTRLDVGGVPEHILTLVSGLMDHGYDVTIACNHVSDAIRRRLQTIGVTIHIIELRRLIHPADLLSAWRLYRYLRQEKFDIVHTHMSKAALLGGICAKAAGIPVIINTAHNLGCIAFPSRMVRTLFWIYDKTLFWLTMDAVILVSDTIRQRIIASGLLPEKKAVFIPNGIDPQPFMHPDEQQIADTRRVLGIKEDNLIIGTVARLVWFKGLSTLIAAMPAIIAEHPRTKLLIVGNGPLREELQQQAQTLGVSEYINFMGEQENIANLLPLFDIFALPSVSEGMPITILEAMATAKAIVATRVGGIPEVLSDGETALLVDPGDYSNLAISINRLLADQKLRDRLGQAGQTKLINEFTNTKMIERTVNFYQQLSNRDYKLSLSTQSRKETSTRKEE